MGNHSWTAWIWFPVMMGFFWAIRGSRRRGWRPRQVDGETSRLEAELAGREAELDDLRERMAELENRLDFAERLLAGRPEHQETRALS